MKKKPNSITETHGTPEDTPSMKVESTKIELIRETVDQESLLHRIANQANAIRSIALDALLLTIIVAVGLAIAWELSQETVIVTPLNVPKGLAERGYTEEILARRLIDELSKIRKGARTSKDDINPNVFPDWSQPDINIPGASISLYEVVRYAKKIFGVDLKVSGEVTRNEKGLNLYLRGLGSGAFEYVTVNSDIDIDQLLHLGAREVMKRIDPFVLAAYLANNDLNGSLDAILYCLANEPKGDDPWAYNLWGRILEDEGKYKRALERFTQAIEVKNDFVLAYGSSGRVLALLEEFSEAEAIFKKAAQIAPDDSTLYATWGESLGLEGRIDDAIEKFKIAVSKDPENEYAYNRWGRVLHKQGDDALALEKFKKVVQYVPNSEVANNNLGNLFRLNNRYEEASFYLKRAIELNSTYTFAYYNLGLLHEELKNDKRALSCYDKALTLKLNTKWKEIIQKDRDKLYQRYLNQNESLPKGCCVCEGE